MTAIQPERQSSPAAERMRLTRQRRRDGMRVIPLEVRDVEVEHLVRLGILHPAARHDRQAIARALETVLDNIPIAWWQEALISWRR